MKKHIRCQICGDKLQSPVPGERACADCQAHTAQPRTSQQAAREFTCAECGTRFILATGELVTCRDTRYCLTCWSAQRYTTHIIKHESIHTPTPYWAIELGVEWPCSLDDVKRRGRELFKKLHPDFGGDHAKFVIARGYYEQAIAYFGQRESEVAL